MGDLLFLPKAVKEFINGMYGIEGTATELFKKTAARKTDAAFDKEKIMIIF